MHFTPYKVGLCYMSVCTDLPREKVAEHANTVMPTMITSKWKLSENATFSGGELNPCPCDTHPTKFTHYLLEC